MESMETLHQLEERLGYRFNDPELLRGALYHSSYANEHRSMGIASNERLEFLGDAVLGFVSADFLYRKHSDLPEGELTRIRAALEEGRLDDANAMLGTPYAIDWPVVHGKGIGSGKLGTPTLNQNYPAAALQPCAGVYLTRIYLDGQWRPAATGIGKRPTVDSSENAAVTCETFVPDFSGNAYGQQPVLEFHKYFCPVRKFNSMDELAALIHHAADESKAYFAALNGAK